MLERYISLLLDQQMTYVEAINFFTEKLTLKSKDFYALEAKYRSLAFTVAGYTSARVLGKFHEELTRAVTDGVSMQTFRADMNGFLSRHGYDRLHPLQAENIFRTNIQTAYSVGAYEEMTSPAVLAARPYWQYEAVDDAHTRPSHAAMDGKVFPADSPVWDIWYPPNGYKCRCGVSSLSARQVAAQGLTVETKVPDRTINGMDMIPMRPDRDFGTNPAKVRFTPDLSDLPESLQRAFEARNENQYGKADRPPL